uniref:Uncharacterized protein n=1 Tax=Oncorhynchus tshawytscha TaxID=74940 RepID=A0AAZ3S5N9_ONCTS
MTHLSHHLNFGMKPDHARNFLSNCGIRQPKYGDREVLHMYMMRKKGSITTSGWSFLAMPLWGFSPVSIFTTGSPVWKKEAWSPTEQPLYRTSTCLC